MTYYLQDNPNPNFAQFGWPRKKVSGVIGVHTAENNTDFEGADPGAEDVAGWISRRTDPGSYHAIADADSRIKLVHPSYAAWADTTNNPHAMSVSGAMKAARWRDLTPERAAAITRNMAYAAAELVQDAIAAGLLDAPTPARRITPAEAIAGSKAGFYGHGETNPGRRYDPGQNFDWNLFLTTYAAAVGGSAAIAPQGTITELTEEDDMFTEEDRERLKNLEGFVWKGGPSTKKGDGDPTSLFGRVITTQAQGRDVQLALTTALPALLGRKDGAVDIPELAKALAGQLAAADVAALAAQLQITVKEQ